LVRVDDRSVKENKYHKIEESINWRQAFRRKEIRKERKKDRRYSSQGNYYITKVIPKHLLL